MLRILIVGFLFIGLDGRAHSIELNYRGIDDPLLSTLADEPALHKLGKEKSLDSKGFQEKFEIAFKAIQKVLRYYGFYNSNVTFKHLDEGIEFQITLGNPVKIREIQLKTDSDEGLSRLREEFNLQQGQSFSHPEYEKAKSKAIRSFLKEGYLKARFVKSRVTILPVNLSADIDLEVEEGIRYRFGALRVEGMESYPDDFYLQWINFKEGDYYSQSKLLAFYQAVQGSGLFSGVSINAPAEQAEGDRVPVILNVVPYPPYSLTAGAGYATDFGPRLRLDLKRYNVFGTGHVFAANMVFDRRQQVLKGNYVIPVTDRPNRSYSVFATIENRILPNDEQHLSNIGFGYHASFGRKGEYNSGAAYNLEQFKNSALNREIAKYFNLSSQGLWLNLDDNVDPAEGSRLEINGVGVAQPVLSDFSALRIEGSGLIYYSFLERLIRFKSRLQLGYLLASKDPGNLPNSLRFFGGGDRSVRGYRYQSLAPKNRVNGEIVGGKAILTSTIEGELRVYEKFGWAVFSDFGGATNDFSLNSFGVSLGTGLRWHSPVGPMGLSVAFPLRNKVESFRLVVTFGSF